MVRCGIGEMNNLKLVAIGECMVEIVDQGGGEAKFGFGGDTLNTAVYLARLGVNVEYLTALGCDPYSERMLAQWRAEGIVVNRVLQVEGELPGLYVIRTDAAGERSFLYWRENSPARRLFELPGAEKCMSAIQEANWIYLSGITLSIMSEIGRERLLEHIKFAVECGARLAFDSNYRPRGWVNADAARAAFEKFLSLAHIALPSFDDEKVLYGDTSLEETAQRLHAMGVAELVVKNGRSGSYVSTQQEKFSLGVLTTVPTLDTTAAGDSYNAAYLAARMRGCSMKKSAELGQQLASIVVQYRGALIPGKAMPILFNDIGAKA
jgi:2-dehydro-3-deoxygluconokinase